LNSVENWEVGIGEISCHPPIVGTGIPLITVEKTHVLVYFNVISPQFLGYDMAAVYARSSFHSNILTIYLIKFYVPVEQRKFQEIQILF